MSLNIKRLLFCFIGFISGLIVWPVTELILTKHSSFSSYLLLTVTQGIFLGVIPGTLFGMVDGIIYKNRYALLKGGLIGLVLGILGGVSGGFLSQKILFMFQGGNSIYIISRSIGVGVLGFFIGMSDGLRSASVKKTLTGVVGGLLGGLIGGLVMGFLSFNYPNLSITRLIGIIIFTTLIGLFYGLIEKSISRGVLYILNGSMKSKEFNIGQRKISIGSSPKNDIVLAGYTGVEERHIFIQDIRGSLVVKKVSPEYLLKLNDHGISEGTLKYEDVIELGSAKIYFKNR